MIRPIMRNELVLQRASAPATEADLPIAQVARMVGYRKPGAFAEAFRRRTGTVPSAYRSGSRRPL